MTYPYRFLTYHDPYKTSSTRKENRVFLQTFHVFPNRETFQLEFGAGKTNAPAHSQKRNLRARHFLLAGAHDNFVTVSHTRLIWSYLTKKVCTSGWLYIEKFKKIVHLYLRLFDRLTWEVSCNAFDKRCVTSERKSPFQQLSIFTRVRRDLSKHVPEWQVGAFCWTSNWSLSKISHHGSSSRATIRHCQHFKSKLSPPFSSQSNSSFEGFVCEAFNERIMATGHSVQLPSGKQIWWSTLLLWTRIQTCMQIVQTQRLCDLWPRDKKTTRKQFTWRATNRLSTIFALKVLKEFKKTAQRPFYQLHCRLESS